MNYAKLISKAIEAKENAYAPYSNFRVGAALLTKDDLIYTGCNIENAAFSPTICAERTAVAKAVSEGHKEFKAIVVTGDNNDYLTPCGVCRQVLVEFCDLEEFKVILANSVEDFKEVSLGELLPGSFSKENLKNQKNLR